MSKLPFRFAQVHDARTQQHRDSRTNHVLLRDFWAIQHEMARPGAPVAQLYRRQQAIRAALQQRGVFSRLASC